MLVQSDIRDIISNKKLMEQFASKRVLVTGATGLIGSMLIKTLHSASEEYGLNIEIIALARSEKRVQEILGLLIKKINVIYSDGFDICVKCDYIFHTASPTTSKYFVEHPVETIDTMLTGTKAMLELAMVNKATLVYLSSMEEYGVPYEANSVMTEDKVGVINHLTSRSCYPEGKRMCECMCASYSSEYGVDTRIVRLAQTFGAGIPLSDNRVSMQFAKSIVEDNDIVLHTEGNSILNFCYLTDAITGILTIAVYGKKAEAYNVCNDEETRTIYEIARLVADKVAKRKISVVIDIPKQEDMGYAPDNTMRLDSTKIKELGWRADVGMEEGYRRLVAYLGEYL